MSTERERQEAHLRDWIRANVRMVSGVYTAGTDQELSELPRSSLEHVARVQLQLRLAELIAKHVVLEACEVNGMLAFRASLGVVFDASVS